MLVEVCLILPLLVSLFLFRLPDLMLEMDLQRPPRLPTFPMSAEKNIPMHKSATNVIASALFRFFLTVFPTEPQKVKTKTFIESN